MWIICQADNSLEMSRLVFSEKKKKKKIKNFSSAAVVIGVLRVKLSDLSDYFIQVQCHISQFWLRINIFYGF